MSGGQVSTDAEPEYLDARGVAARIGVKTNTLYAYITRGHAPEPDLVWLGRNLWLVSTIDEWRARKGKHGQIRIPRREKIAGRPRPVSPSRRLPPRIADSPRSLPDDPTARPATTIVTPQIASQIAASLREAGHYCTRDDVLELATAPVPADRERELLQGRILAKLRGLRARANEGGRRTPGPERATGGEGAGSP